MRYTVYKTTNTINGKFYIGAHRTENPNDGYLGSGKALRNAIRKYGRAAFVKEVLFDFDTPDEMWAQERELVTPEFKRDPGNYNLLEGGKRSPVLDFSPEKRAEISRRGLARRRELLQNPEYRAKVGDAISRALPNFSGEGNNFFGKTHTDETKAKMGGPRPTSAGSRNSQFGTVWVCREGETPRKIPKAELPAFQDAGWQRGRRVRP